MRGKRIDNIIPIETNNKGIWFMDISQLSLSELINLRNELSKKSTVSISSLDGIIHKEAGSNSQETNFRKREYEKRKQGYRNKAVLIKMKRRKK